MQRTKTRKIQVGNLTIGGNEHIYIQSMTNTLTKDVDATVKQILELENAGCEIIRVAVLDMEDAKSISKIKSQIHIPIVADIHFDYKLALESINQGVNKIRLNPGNIKNEEHVKLIVESCKKNNIPIRIGVNSGSLPNGDSPTVENMISACKLHVDILEKLNFHNIILSLKATDMLLMVDVYKKASEIFDYPLHLGVTEAGTSFSGSIKSAMGIGILLSIGIGNTIRVSLTANPILEIKAAKEILKNLNLRDDIPNLVSCPTCGRIQYDMIEIAQKIETYLSTINKKVTVAIMGCPVNGPGEAKHADIGVAGGKKEAVLFKKGVIVKKIKQDEIYDALVEEINNY